MRNTAIVARFEILALLSRPSFWLLTVLFPLFILLLSFGGQLMGGGSSASPAAMVDDLLGTGAMVQPMGYVDESGIIQEMLPGIPPGLLLSFPNEAQAQEALAAEQIDRYFVIAADFVESGNLSLVQQTFEPFGSTNEQLIQALLNYNLIGDAARMALIGNPLGAVDYQVVADQVVDGQDAGLPGDGAAGSLDGAASAPGAVADPLLATLVPIVAVILFFFVLVMSSGYMLRSVSREKENRTVEVLLLSLRPRQLMVGKLMGLSVVAMVQMGLWLAAGALFLDRGVDLFALAGSVNLPLSFVLWVVVYMALGYVLYASLMGALGALAPNAREGNQFSFAVLLPLIIPVWLNGFLVQAPNGNLAVVLSLFPLTAPPSMIARLAATQVPLWQPLVSVAGLAVTTYLVLLLSARFFRADTLLSSASLHWRSILRAATGR